LIGNHPGSDERGSLLNQFDNPFKIFFEIPCEDWFVMSNPVAEPPDSFQILINCPAKAHDRVRRIVTWKDPPQMSVP
jgi:hypothetical protein